MRNVASAQRGQGRRQWTPAMGLFGRQSPPEGILRRSFDGRAFSGGPSSSCVGPFSNQSHSATTDAAASAEMQAASSTATQGPPRLFWVGMVPLLLVAVILGFRPTYFPEGRPATRKASSRAAPSSTFMGSALLLTQTILIARGNQKTDMPFGPYVPTFGLVVVVIGAYITYVSVANFASPTTTWGEMMLVSWQSGNHGPVCGAPRPRIALPNEPPSAQAVHVLRDDGRCLCRHGSDGATCSAPVRSYHCSGGGRPHIWLRSLHRASHPPGDAHRDCDPSSSLSVSRCSVIRFGDALSAGSASRVDPPASYETHTLLT